MAALLAAACSFAVALGGVSVETDGRIYARGREVRMEGGSLSTAELELVPRLALVRTGPRLELSLAYAPRLDVPVVLSAGAPEPASGREVRGGEILHHGDVSFEAAAIPNLSLRFRGEGDYGRIDLLRSEAYAEAVVPTAHWIAWRSARASMEATAMPTRRTILSASLAAFETGGGDDEARTIVPLQRGARAGASLRRGMTPRDELSLTGEASYARLTPATEIEDAAIARVAVGWTRQASSTLVLRAAPGVGWTYARPIGSGHAWEVSPFVEAGLSHSRRTPPIGTDLTLRMAPDLSPLTGVVEQRLEASAVTTWQPLRDWQVAVRGAATLTRSETSHGAFWTGERRADVASLELRASWAFARRGTLSFGLSGRWQRGHHPAVPTFLDLGGGIGLTYGGRWPA